MSDPYETLVFPTYPRQQIRAHLVDVRKRTGSAMPDAAIDEIVDLACHAAETGRRAMLAVIDRASDPRISTTAVGIAVSLLAHDLNLMTEGFLHAAQTVGAHYETATVGVPAHG